MGPIYSVSLIVRCIIKCNPRFLTRAYMETLLSIHSMPIAYTARSVHSFIHFWHAPLWVHSAKCRQQSPEWMILSHVNCFVQAEVHWFQVLLGSLHPDSTGVKSIARSVGSRK